MSKPQKPLSDDPSAQEVFDHIAAHLLMQGRQAFRGHGKCAYRAPNGDRCAVGAVIPDEAYRVRMEDKSVAALLEYSTTPAWFGKRFRLLHVLQWVHDNIEASKWPDELRHIANTWSGLNADIVDLLTAQPVVSIALQQPQDVADLTLAPQ